MKPAAHLLALGLVAAGSSASSPAAATGPVVITQQSVVAGGVTPGDAAGFPAKITAPGSYRLGGNLTVPDGNVGIEVTTSDVSIDLDGFRIAGGPAGGTSNGIFGVSTTGDRLTVRNGTITGFEGAGIYASSKLFLVVEDMRLINNAFGLDAGSSKFTRVANSTIALNSATGMRCGLSCQLEGSIVSNNTYHGITIVSGTVLGNTFANNGGYAIVASTSIGVAVGFGNNTLIGNNPGGAGGGLQRYGKVKPLQPNACEPTAC